MTVFLSELISHNTPIHFTSCDRFYTADLRINSTILSEIGAHQRNFLNCHACIAYNNTFEIISALCIPQQRDMRMELLLISSNFFCTLDASSCCS